jgi:hypothetical protein
VSAGSAAGSTLDSDQGIAGLVAELEALDVDGLSRVDVMSALSKLSRVRGWVDVLSARLARRLQVIAEDSPSILPEADIATATKSSQRDAGQATRRAGTLGAMPALETALAAGKVTAEHVDAVGRAMKRLKPEQRESMAGDDARIAAIAARSTPEQLEATLKVEVVRLDSKEGTERLARQKRSIRLRSWTDRDTGMLVVRAEYDPESGLVLMSRIDSTADRLFHKSVPEDCPEGEGRQDFLRAAALLKLVGRRGGTGAAPGEPAGADPHAETGTEAEADANVDANVDADGTDGDVDVDADGTDGDVDRTDGDVASGDSGAVGFGRPKGAAASSFSDDLDITRLDNRCEMIVVIDLDSLLSGLHAKSIINNGYNLDLPIESYRRMACMAAIIPVVLNSDGVALDEGRKVRLATRAQRRALIAMYDNCGIPGCTVSSRHCQPHHITWSVRWGDTDLDNLIPLCSRHHHAVHEGGWQLVMHADRSLTITYPDGTVRTTGPPVQRRRRAA